MPIEAAGESRSPYTSELFVVHNKETDDEGARSDPEHNRLPIRPLLPLIDIIDVVAPIVGQVLRTDELEAFTVCHERSPVGTWVPTVKIRAAGEDFSLQLAAAPDDFDPHRAADLLRSSLQDFVAESKFGWGKQR